MPVREPQAAAAVLMVRPACFGFNAQTAASNTFQSPDIADLATAEKLTAENLGTDQERALREFDAVAAALTRAGVTVIVAADTPAPVKPDAIFPNNWVSFHRDGTAVLYPMLAVNRRFERRDAVLEAVGNGYRLMRTVDLSHHEADGKFLEGTGSLVLDRAHRLAYACLSPRTDLDVLGEFAQQLDYELVVFEAVDAAARPVYHTNVMMAVGSHFAVLCGAAIPNPAHRLDVADKLRASGHEILEISAPQMHAFAGNLLELRTSSGALIVLSCTAWESLDARQRRCLEHHGSVLAVDIPRIERLGGGGVRCMLAEIHLPSR